MRIQSVGNVLETAEIDNFAYGGKSSSKTLNRMAKTIKTDLEATADTAQYIKASVIELLALMSSQAAAIGVCANELATQLAGLKAEAATGYPKTVRLDMYMPSVITDTGDAQVTTATVNKKFGQATLPVVGESDWLVAKDMDNNLWVPEQTKLLYSTSDTVDVFLLSETAMIPAEEASGAFDHDAGSAWVEEVDGQAYASVFVRAPVEVLVGGYANTLEICPFPLFAHDLISAEIVTQEGIRKALTFDSSIPGYTTESGTPVINNFGNLRFFFSPTSAYGIKLLIRLSQDHTYWGFTDIALKTTKFDTTGRLSFSIGQYTPVNAAAGYSSISAELVGSDPEYLATLTKTISSTCVQVDLAQQASGMTPVISAADVSWTTPATPEEVTSIFR